MVHIAAVNSPTAVTVSGPERDIVDLHDRCARNGLTATRLTVGHGFHSPAMQPAADRLQDVLAGIDMRPPAIPVLSNLTGDYADRSHHYGPARLLVGPTSAAAGAFR